MNVLRGVLVALVGVMMVQIGSAQNKRQTTTETKEYPNGEVQVKTTTVLIDSKHPDFLEYYHKKKVKTEYYDSLGNMVYLHEHVDKKGTYGRPCYELYYEFTKYRSDGTKEWTYESKCDCRWEIYREYNEKGKLLREEKKRIHRPD